MPPFALVTIDGGDAVNWHARANGDDPVAMITDELLPQLAARQLTTERLALWGWSLGGFGALHLAGVLGAERVAAVVATSPALWRGFDETMPGTFDDAADFARVDLFGRTGQQAGIPVRIDCGKSDAFAERARDFRAALATTPAGGLTPGCHDNAYWTRMVPEQLAFIGRRLNLQL